MVPNLDLMNKGLRLKFFIVIENEDRINVPNLDLMNKGLRLP